MLKYDKFTKWRIFRPKNSNPSSEKFCRSLRLPLARNRDAGIVSVSPGKLEVCRSDFRRLACHVLKKNDKIGNDGNPRFFLMRRFQSLCVLHFFRNELKMDAV